jgi:hypothetical protein
MGLVVGQYPIQHVNTGKWYRGTVPVGKWWPDFLYAKTYPYWDAQNIALPRNGKWVRIGDIYPSTYKYPTPRQRWRSKYGYGKGSRLRLRK